MEPQLKIDDLGIAFSKLAEALCIEMNVPVKRRYTHEELADSIAAIRQIESSKLRVPTSGEIDVAMLEALKP